MSTSQLTSEGAGPDVSGFASSTGQDPNRARLPDIDLLRFIAAAMVLLYHYISSYIAPRIDDSFFSAVSLVTRYGYLGVELFFMISGFVIVWSAQKRSAPEFVISRFSRLYPTFWVAMLLTALAIFLLEPLVVESDPTRIDLRTLAANATMMPQIFDAPRIDGVYWTLEFEIRFYFLVFLLVLFGQMPRLELWLYTWLATCVVSLWISLPWALSYFLLLSYAPFFIAGALFYVVFANGWSIKRALGIMIVMGLCIQSALRHKSGFLIPDAASVWIVPAITVLFFLVFLVLIRARKPWVSGAIAYRLGALTYPLYLTHAAIGLLLVRLMLEPLGPYMTFFVVTVFAFLLAQILVVTVDEPARRPAARMCRYCLERVIALVPLPRKRPGSARRRPSDF